MSLNEYQEQILENYKHPKNFGTPEWNPTTLFKSENISCGDEIEMYLLIVNDTIKDISFSGRGCSIAIASASLLTEELKGKNINEALSYTEQDLKTILGIPLTTSRLVCATLSLDAVHKALKRN